MRWAWCRPWSDWRNRSSSSSASRHPRGGRADADRSRRNGSGSMYSASFATGFTRGCAIRACRTTWWSWCWPSRRTIPTAWPRPRVSGRVDPGARLDRCLHGLRPLQADRAGPAQTYELAPMHYTEPACGLYEASESAKKRISESANIATLGAVLRAYLQAPINRFFTDVLVNADDPAVRQARWPWCSALRPCRMGSRIEPVTGVLSETDRTTNQPDERI